MSPLRKKMIRELQLQRMSDNTVKAYVLAVEQLSKHYSRSPADLSVEEVCEFLHHLIVERKLSTSSVNVRLAGIKFFFRRFLGQEGFNLHIRTKRTGRLPQAKNGINATYQTWTSRGTSRVSKLWFKGPSDIVLACLGIGLLLVASSNRFWVGNRPTRNRGGPTKGRPANHILGLLKSQINHHQSLVIDVLFRSRRVTCLLESSNHDTHSHVCIGRTDAAIHCVAFG